MATCFLFIFLLELKTLVSFEELASGGTDDDLMCINNFVDDVEEDGGSAF